MWRFSSQCVSHPGWVPGGQLNLELRYLLLNLINHWQLDSPLPNFFGQNYLEIFWHLCLKRLGTSPFAPILESLSKNWMKIIRSCDRIVKFEFTFDWVIFASMKQFFTCRIHGQPLFERDFVLEKSPTCIMWVYFLNLLLKIFWTCLLV